MEYTGVRIFILIIFYVHSSWSSTIFDETSLQTNLLSNYSTGIRPGADRNQPLNISIKIYVLNLREYDENSGKFSIAGALGIGWNDNRLTWDPSQNGDVYTINMLQSQIWLPLLMLLNGYNSNIKGIGVDNLSVLLNYDGTIYWSPPAIFESTCDADVTYYPFDSQTCTLKFFFPGYSVNEIRLVATENTADMKIYETNGLWDVTSTRLYSVVNALNFEEFRIEFSMNRRSTYYVVGLILPICLLNFVQLVVFILPAESGERVGFTITVLLAVAVFLTIIQDKLPESSEPSVSWITYKLLIDLLIGCLLVTSVVYGLRFNNKDEKEKISSKFKSFTRFMLQKQTCLSKHDNVVQNSEKATEKVPVEDGDVTIDVFSWKEVGFAFDRFCLITFSLSLIFNNLIYLAVMSSLGSK